MWFDSSAFNARERLPPILPYMSCLNFVSRRCSRAWFRVWRNPSKLPTKPLGTLDYWINLDWIYHYAKGEQGLDNI